VAFKQRRVSINENCDCAPALRWRDIRPEKKVRAPSLPTD
jgi:hypothetical protein